MCLEIPSIDVYPNIVYPKENIVICFQVIVVNSKNALRAGISDLRLNAFKNTKI